MRGSNTLKINGGEIVDALSYEDLEEIDLHLEYYFRSTDWEEVLNFINHEKSFDNLRENLNIKEIESTFNCLKRLSEKKNITPYEEGYLEIDDSFVNDETILGLEEFFIREKEWTICLATKVRNYKLCEPWMNVEPPSPEYFVSNCLINMLENEAEKKKYIDKKFISVTKNETGI